MRAVPSWVDKVRKLVMDNKQFIVTIIIILY